MDHILLAFTAVSPFESALSWPPGASEAHSMRLPPRAIGGRSSRRVLQWSMTSPRDSISDELESLVLRFARFAGRIANDRGLPHEDIDELLQELRVRFWRARKDGLLDLSANYVRRAAISAALDIIRRRRVDRNVSLDESESRPISS